MIISLAQARPDSEFITVGEGKRDFDADADPNRLARELRAEFQRNITAGGNFFVFAARPNSLAVMSFPTANNAGR